MTENPASQRRAAALWFLAALLAATAAVITYVRQGEIRWYLVAAPTFMLAMAWSSWRRGSQ